ncbi:MAG TPA: DUF5916 domain-containing protein [Blastocatellia bacterium]|nr:DUF5916 domain-containing protein [Blastocatellia bacterium]
MKRFSVAILALVFCLLAARISVAQQEASASNGSPGTAKPPSTKTVTLPPEKANPITIPKFEKPPVIDGKLDDEVWRSAIVLKDFYQIQPGDNIAPSKPAEVLLGYDSKTWYIAFRCPDDAGKVRASVSKRDNIWEDDNVGMFIDTFNDKRKAYALFFNPLGIQADGTLTETSEDYSLDIVMESKGVVTEDGYTVEIAIPFKSLRYEAGKGKLWGAHFFRRIKRFNNELNSWMPIDRSKSSWIVQEGHLAGLEGIATERQLEVIPTLTISHSGRRVPTIPNATIVANPNLVDPGRMVNSPPNLDPGLSVKLGITPNITLDFAANPDFAQVEADQPVVTTNQRFPIFFAEKRPFFLEGIDIFQTTIAAVHTRAIVDPDYAAKLTGKVGRNTFGLLLASDNAPGNFSEEEVNDPEIFPDIEKFVGKNAYIGVLRLKRDVGKESSLGFLATSYNFIERHNQLAGFDGRIKLDKATTLTFQALGTTSRRHFYDPERDESVYRTGNGLVYYAGLDYTGRNFGYFFEALGRTRDYRADVGFTRRTNTNSNFLFMRYNNDPKPKATLISWRVFNGIGVNYDFQGRMQNWNNETQGQIRTKGNTWIGLGTDFGYERLFEEEFGAIRTLSRGGAFFGPDSERSSNRRDIYGYIESAPSKKYSLFVFMSKAWGGFDLDFGGGPRFPRVSPAALVDPEAPLDPGAGNSFTIDSNFTYKPIAALNTSIGYIKSRLVRRDTGLLAFDDNIISWRTTYQFTRFTFLRARIDYDSLASSMRGQYLFGWTPNPGTSFYVGYNDDLTYNGFDQFTGNPLPGFRRNNRTFFIKTSYLIRRSL